MEYMEQWKGFVHWSEYVREENVLCIFIGSKVYGNICSISEAYHT